VTAFIWTGRCPPKPRITWQRAEDYYSDKTIEDADVLYTGVEALPEDFWEQHGKDMRSWKEGDRTWYQVNGPAAGAWRPNVFVYEAGPQGIEAIVRGVNGEAATLELARDFRSERHSVWGITARNRDRLEKLASGDTLDGRGGPHRWLLNKMRELFDF